MDDDNVLLASSVAGELDGRLNGFSSRVPEELMEGRKVSWKRKGSGRREKKTHEGVERLVRHDRKKLLDQLDVGLVVGEIALQEVEVSLVQRGKRRGERRTWP